ncbi:MULTISPECIES: DUF4178 domain-containing protein [unclassified Paenibacillus]|uniref:DUF4178 domain-containing protein n=1 Tax=Paenibacillus provencensis TaxID=441151 RepID=A0ABW3PSN2_9BACL|nr:MULTISPECIES: DUF4178 domain-containing protein [unclassified Paenibacillus]MCM3126736.1 DUF4178 domain-containing protein [Paenibacillus sp. MER 78]SFS58052.1 protein of unknown function [Paenibacillus sp. 453mf]
MSIWKRVTSLLSKPKPEPQEKSMLQLAPGDICEVSLITYEVVGRVQNRGRNAVVLTIQDGNQLAYLHIEERERLTYGLYQPIDGRLDSPDEVPTTIELDDRDYHMEEQYAGHVLTTGRTPFSQSGEQHVWQYQSDDNHLLRIEWQNGRFMLYEGEHIIPADVKVIRAT